MHPQPAVTSDSRGPACTPTTPRQFQVSGWEVRQPSGDRVTTEESRETLEPGWGKPPRSSFTTATSGGWEHATGLRAAATFSAFLAPPRQIRPLASASPASRLPPVRRPSPSSRIRASSENAGSRCDRSAGPKPHARSRARRTSLRMRRGVDARAQTARVARVSVSHNARSSARILCLLVSQHPQPTDVQISSLRRLFPDYRGWQPDPAL